MPAVVGNLEGKELLPSPGQQHASSALPLPDVANCVPLGKRIRGVAHDLLHGYADPCGNSISGKLSQARSRADRRSSGRQEGVPGEARRLRISRRGEARRLPHFPHRLKGSRDSPDILKKKTGREDNI